MSFNENLRYINLKAVLNLLIVVIIQLFLENITQHVVGDRVIRISVSMFFLAGVSLQFIFTKPNFIFPAQIIIGFLNILLLIPHGFFFNLFSFYSRVNYLILNKSILFLSLIGIICFLLILYFVARLQVGLVRQLRPFKSIFIIGLILLISAKLIFRYTKYRTANNVYMISYINQNHIWEVISDYKIFQAGKTKITPYNCVINNNKSPSFRFFYNTEQKRELLLIVESWGLLGDSIDQAICQKYLSERLIKLNKNFFNLQFGSTCFHGNTCAAEGRELLNMNDEESYRSFLNGNDTPGYNLIAYKNRNNYLTISGFAGSKLYGSNFSNSSGFRQSLGFRIQFYYEDLSSYCTQNFETTYLCVSDEFMVDSLCKASQLAPKTFAYGLSINTHGPFKLAYENYSHSELELFEKKFLSVFQDEKVKMLQFFRLTRFIEHTLLSVQKYGIDKVLIIGDHPYVALGTKFIYNDSQVPYLLLERNK